MQSLRRPSSSFGLVLAGTLLFVGVGALVACSTTTVAAGPDTSSTTPPGPTSIAVTDLGATCAGGSNPGTARAFVSTDCPAGVCLFDGRTDPGSGPLSYCTAKCDRAACPGGFTCDTITDSSGNTDKYCIFTDRNAPRATDAGADAEVDAAPAIKRAFVSSTVTYGDFGGQTPADAMCQSAATKASLGGTWRALIASDGKPLTKQGPFYLVDKTTYLSSVLPDPINGIGISHALDMDENGQTVANGTKAWTGSFSDCGGWNTGSATEVGTTGTATSIPNFFGGGVTTCLSSKAALYCFEQ